METDFLYDTVDGNMNSPFLFSLVKLGNFLSIGDHCWPPGLAYCSVCPVTLSRTDKLQFV